MAYLYSNLQTDLAGVIHRTIPSTLLPGWSQRASARISKHLRSTWNESSISNLVWASGKAPLPTDFREIRRVYTASAEVPQWGAGATRAWSSSGASSPMAYTVRGRSIIVAPAPTDGMNSSIMVDYFRAVPVLTNTTDTDTTLEYHTEVWLAAFRIEAHTWDHDYDSLKLAAADFESAIEEANKSEAASRSAQGAVQWGGAASPQQASG